MSESENLIVIVKKYPCIWDPSHADYYDRDVKEYAWDQICREVIDDWDMCDDKINKCAEVKKKWTHIRDYYRKKLMNTKNATGSAAKKSKTYIYSQLLNFLKPVFKNKDSEDNFIKEDSDSNEQQSYVEEDNLEEEEAVYLETPGPSLTASRRKKPVPRQTFNDDEDDDTKFLLSFRGYMKCMNHHQKLDFKMGVLQLVKKVTIGEDISSHNRHDKDSLE